MHTIEHIGLGRYGDTIDPKGDIKAINELKRIVKPDGNLIIVVPVGKPKIFFNAHRVYSFEMIIELMNDFQLVEFSMVYDNKEFIKNANPKDVENQKYGCGCFWFIKR
jgi:ubiquinone/menaquinone biosynthesis C-methylase UbiE